MADKVFFDGGARPNPGPIEVAVVVRGRTHRRDGLGTGSNGDAEWLALIEAARMAVATGLGDVVFLGDSMHVVGQAGGRAPCRGASARRHLAAFRAAAAGIAQWRIRHVGRSRNLAGIALERGQL